LRDRILIKKQFQGFLETPNLWNGKQLGLEQFGLPKFNIQDVELPVKSKLRLGHLVETFIKEVLTNSGETKLLEHNLQVNSTEETLGEFDFIVETNQGNIHIESTYKFYLYDPNKTTSETSKWIGPNRKDSFNRKIQKIREKQFPLLEHEESRKTLAAKKIDPESIVQKVLFKAQLYIPKNEQLEIDYFNKKCIAGYYYSFNEFIEFSKSKVFIPSKHNWLTHPYPHVDWLPFEQAQIEIRKSLAEHFSPMIWLKHENGEIEKCFVVWWK
jgi:hypothetical protein